jgi:hypothetical protein
MKVLISQTIDVDSITRSAIAHYYGEPGKADHAMIRQYVMSNGDDFSVIVSDYHRSQSSYHEEKAEEALTLGVK